MTAAPQTETLPGRQPLNQTRATMLLVAAMVGLMLILLLGPNPAMAGPAVEVVGLFKQRAVIRVGGSQHVLKVGETSPEGVELIEATTDEATILVEGEKYTLSLSNRISTGYKAPKERKVTINSDELGQYRVRGEINTQYVDFLIDTGASVVAMSSEDATRLGINYKTGHKGMVKTAQGTTESFFIVLDKVSVADIDAHHVQATVIEGGFPQDILLGMSFLRQVAMQEQGGIMTLTKNF